MEDTENKALFCPKKGTEEQNLILALPIK